MSKRKERSYVSIRVTVDIDGLKRDIELHLPKEPFVKDMRGSFEEVLTRNVVEMSEEILAELNNA